ncbi:MAG: flagellar motor stator protein MotA [Thermodesulfobacteriota bacterium]
MFAIIGIVVVLAAVVGGYLMEHGNLSVLFQPAEVVIIGGAALGAFLIASPRTVVAATLRGALRVFTGKEAGRETYMELLMLLYELLVLARKEGVRAIEAQVNDPSSSPVFGRYPRIQGNHEVSAFICDNFKVFMAGGLEPLYLDSLMELDMDTQHAEEQAPSGAVSKVADSLPGLGIVAAVLGVVLTMGKIKEPPEVLGHSIGAALVGTFLGVLLCYGFVGPMAHNLENRARDHQAMLGVVKASILAYAQGIAPVLALEAGRRAVPTSLRPSYAELEGAMRGVKK